ncbi:MAG: TetR/AcrR family transcriptional regulator [Candidatus Competibacterales bacterium]|nr:TetR/AcrR family transcriptional regulator [Candidatus Competibacterales bacterium]
MQPSKREAVLDTAERLFYEEGFHATGIDRVVAEAGVARMTLYNHFPSKEVLIESVLVRRYRRYLDDLRDAVAARGQGSAVGALARRHNHWLRHRAPNGCIVLKAIGEFDRHCSAIAERGRALKGELLALLVEAAAMDGHDDAAAEQVLLLLEGASALAPVLGPARAVAHVEAMLGSLPGGDSVQPS